MTIDFFGDKVERMLKWIILMFNKYQKENAGTKWHSKIPIVGTGDRNVLMANEKGKRIAIQDYITWLRCSHKIHLTSDEPYEEKPNLTEQQLCSGNPLQTYIQK